MRFLAREGVIRCVANSQYSIDFLFCLSCTGGSAFLNLLPSGVLSRFFLCMEGGEVRFRKRWGIFGEEEGEGVGNFQRLSIGGPQFHWPTRFFCVPDPGTRNYAFHLRFFM